MKILVTGATGLIGSGVDRCFPRINGIAHVEDELYLQ